MKEDSNIYYTENELKNKLLTPEQVNMFFRFIDTYQENNELKDELKYLVEDYNRVIISALNLSNMSTQSQRNVNYSTKANYSATQLNYKDYPISNENSKIENVTTNNAQSIIERANDSIDGNMSYSSPLDANMIKMKKTNEILKRIDNTLDNQKYFAARYTNCNSYKTFLDNLINYQYSLSELNDIKNDIERFKKYTPSSIPLSPRRIAKEENVYDFDKSLRRYQDSKKDLEYLNKPQFIRFTRTYGDFFDKSLNRVSSPLRHKPQFE